MTRANRTAKGSICRISAVFAEIKAASPTRSLDDNKGGESLTGISDITCRFL